MERDPQNENEWAFYYDGDCHFCTTVVGWLTRVDFLDQIVWTSFQSLESPPEGLTWDDLDRSAYLQAGRGRLHEGFYAIRMLTVRLVALMPLAPLFWFPGAPLIGVAAYRWVARNRYRFPIGRSPDK